MVEEDIPGVNLEYAKLNGWFNESLGALNERLI
jgi:hypothetical protein